MTREEEIAALKAKLKARQGKTGFKANVAEIEAHIATLEAQE
jgi:hypothetical protein